MSTLHFLQSFLFSDRQFVNLEFQLAHPVFPTTFCIELQLSSPSLTLVQQSTHSLFVDVDILYLYFFTNVPIINQLPNQIYICLTKIRMNSKNQKTDKDLNDSNTPDSPRFGGVTHKAGLYGQPQHQFINESKKSPIQNTHATITKAELIKHKTKASAWISLKGVVYDVTSYIQHHPGGDILLEGCGAQSQKLFDEHHSWINAKGILANCVLGRLENL